MPRTRTAAAGKMGYEDFIVFYMSEEDKSTESALRFWFTVCDLDGDGVLTTADLRPFYRCEKLSLTIGPITILGKGNRVD